MSYKIAVNCYYEHCSKERCQPRQPTHSRSIKNRRGWHLYNNYEYLGSINGRGEFFVVVSRVTSNTEKKMWRAAAKSA